MIAKSCAIQFVVSPRPKLTVPKHLEAAFLDTTPAPAKPGLFNDAPSQHNLGGYQKHSVEILTFLEGKHYANRICILSLPPTILDNADSALKFREDSSEISTKALVTFAFDIRI